MLTGFETYDASIREATVKISKMGIIFNKGTVVKLGEPEFVELGLDETGKRIAIQAIYKKTNQSLSFPTNGEPETVKWGSKEIINTISKLSNLDLSQNSYRIVGDVIEKENAIIFDLNNAQPIKGRRKA